MKTLKIFNRESAALELRSYQMIHRPELPSVTIAARQPFGPEVVLKPGVNEVDEEFWLAWSEANKGSDLLSKISVVAEEQPAPDHSLLNTFTTPPPRPGEVRPAVASPGPTS